MRCLLDTDVISQLTKDRPHEKVLAWIEHQDEDNLFLSVATLLEIRYGIERTQVGKKREKLERWLVHDLQERFDGRIVPIERHTADLAGQIIARSQNEGWKMDSMDALIGATAMTHDMTLATLNRKHFEQLGVKLVEF
ncbi:type II toxin-antitoxin system VapC family toxin [Edaphobacter acidisoli]|uniref:type II toxin-antitoxin system VapC family toxin n=1 Tax=Edaphobacter acidisoli TaxID=2040573 RepID=UPI0021DF7F83|nr:type II toxin-antitoxin system VapC family toxin [Edaphobacter acidisoli]